MTDYNFRAMGWTDNAINYPLSERAIAFRLRYNGVASGPAEWRFAPNPWVQADLDAKGSLSLEEQDQVITASRPKKKV